jgi:DNA-binding MarR family transcriptional regulator
VSGFCAYYGVTPGTASETIRRMIGRGLLQSYQSPIDGRSVLLEMTLKARGLLKEDPSQILVSVVERLPVAQATAVAAALEQVARMIGERHGRRVFGSCGGCRHFSAGRARAGARRQRCRLLGVRIEAGEEQALCAMFEGS